MCSIAGRDEIQSTQPFDWSDSRSGPTSPGNWRSMRHDINLEPRYKDPRYKDNRAFKDIFQGLIFFWYVK